MDKVKETSGSKCYLKIKCTTQDGVSITKTYSLMLYTEVIECVLYHTKHINTLCGKMQSF